MRRSGMQAFFLLSNFLAGPVMDAAAAEAGRPTAYVGARILPAVGIPIEKGTLLVDQGKILAVGRTEAVEIPKGALVIDLAGKTIIPGLVDTHSHVGVWPKPTVSAHQDGNEGSGPVQSAIRAMDAVFPDDPGIRMAVAGGVTTANIMPGSGNVIGGQTIYVKFRGATVEAMRLIPGSVLGGLKMANGENPKRWNFDRNKSAPSTRMKLAALQRDEFVKAQEYQRHWAAYRQAKADGKKDAMAPDRDLALEPLVEVLEHKRTVHFHSHRADDLMTVLRLADEFGFEVVLQHGTDSYRIIDELKKRKVPVSLTLIDSPGGKPEVAGLLEETASILDKAGLLVAINTDDSITESRFFLRTGAIAVRGGMSEESALRALTINGAKMLHLEGRLGSLEKGKDADFVVLSGPPFSLYSVVLQTYIEGAKIFDRVRQGDWPYQVGGFGLRDRMPAKPALIQSPQPAEEPGPDAQFLAFKNNPKRFVIHAGRVHTVVHGTIEDGVILIEDGKIKAVGKRGKVVIPPGTAELTTAVVTPGLIDAHTVVGLSGGANVGSDQDQDEGSDPNQADLRVLDGFNPLESLLTFLRSQGVTVIHAVPGPSNVIAGQTGIFHTFGRTAEGMAVRFPAGLLVNLGEKPKSSYPNRLTTRMGTAGLIRGAFVQAANYAAKKAAATTKDKRPAANAKWEALGLALNKKIPVIFAAHRGDDLQTALRLAKEFDLKARLDLATEAYLMADELARAGVPVVVHPPMQRVSSMETLHTFLGNAAVLADHKVLLAVGTGFEPYVPKTRVLRHEAAMALVNGLGSDRALRAITLDAARILGIADQYGSLEPGKVADLVLYDGDPFEHTSHVKMTIQEGRVVFDRAEYLKLPFERRALPLVGGGGVGCCLGGW